MDFRTFALCKGIQLKLGVSMSKYDKMQNKKFEVKIYLFPKSYRIEAKTKVEAMEKVLSNYIGDIPFAEIEAEEILKDEDSCENHFEFIAECKDCTKKLKDNVESINNKEDNGLHPTDKSGGIRPTIL